MVFLLFLSMPFYYFNRRNFLKGLTATAILWQFPFLQSCQKTAVSNQLSKEKQQILHRVFEILFPPLPGPGFKEINAIQHLKKFLSDPLIDPEEQQFIINVIDELNEHTLKETNQNFITVNKNQQKKVFKTFLSNYRGEAWASKLLTIIFEALLLDPIYNINKNEAGWKFVLHIPGKPQPNHSNKYPEILKRKKENIIITDLKQL